MKVKESASRVNQFLSRNTRNPLSLAEAPLTFLWVTERICATPESIVVYGRGRAVVVAAGMDTEMGKIADAISQAEGTDSTSGALDKHTLTILVVVICCLFLQQALLSTVPRCLATLTLSSTHGCSFLLQ